MALATKRPILADPSIKRVNPARSPLAHPVMLTQLIDAQSASLALRDVTIDDDESLGLTLFILNGGGDRFQNPSAVRYSLPTSPDANITFSVRTMPGK
jgi:hypothetical protein